MDFHLGLPGRKWQAKQDKLRRIVGAVRVLLDECGVGGGSVVLGLPRRDRPRAIPAVLSLPDVSMVRGMEFVDALVIYGVKVDIVGTSTGATESGNQ